MDRRPRPAKISQAEYTKPAFARIIRQGDDDPRFAKVVKAGASSAAPKTRSTRQICGVGYIALKNMPAIIQRFADNRDQFRTCMNAVIGAVEEIVTGDGGWLQKFSGDGFLFAFPNTARTNGATQAIITGLKMRYRMNKLNRAWNFYRGEAWMVRTGVHAGTVVITRTGTDEDFRITIQGETAELATALSRKGSAGQVLISDDAFSNGAFQQALFQTGASRMIQPKGADFSLRVREIVAMVQSKVV